MNILLDESFQNFFKKEDIFVVYREFRDSLKEFERYGFRREMPAYLGPKQKQLTWQEANRFTKVTKVRHTFEVAIGTNSSDISIKSFKIKHFFTYLKTSEQRSYS
jgi:hypothetical protein